MIERHGVEGESWQMRAQQMEDGQWVDVKKSSKQTPKVAPKVVKSAKKTPSNALKKTGKRPLYADILKKNLGKTPKKSQAASKASGVVTKNLVKKDVKRLQTPKNKKIKSVVSTGHVNSPASIVITKKKTPKKSATEETPKKAPNKKETPKITPKKGTPLAKKGNPKRTSIMDEIPSNPPPNIVTTPGSKKSSGKRYPLNMSAVETNARLGSASSAKKPRRQTIGSPMATPKNRMLERVKRGTPASEKGRRRNSFRESPSAALLSQSLNSDSPGDLNATNFDFDAMETPPVPVELLVSPMAGASGKGKKRKSSGIFSLLGGPGSPQADYTNVAGVKQLVATPRRGRPPKNDLTDVAGVKKMMATPKPIKSPNNTLDNVEGVKKLMSTPKPSKSPVNALEDLKGVKQLLTTPSRGRGCPRKSPKNDLSDVAGVKKMMTTPKDLKSPMNVLDDVRGVKKMMSTPKLTKSPTNSLSDLKGVKKLMKSPGGPMIEPNNDLTNVEGVKELLRSPKAAQKTPKNDLTNVAGVKHMFATPKHDKGPNNDLTNVAGVKQLMKSAKAQKSPKNALDDLTGVAELVQP